jgi:hypothetical protein
MIEVWILSTNADFVYRVDQLETVFVWLQKEPCIQKELCIF